MVRALKSGLRVTPARVVIDIRQDAMVERDVAWAPGLRWRQQYITVGRDRFPVYMFVARPNPATLALTADQRNVQQRDRHRTLVDHGAAAGRSRRGQRWLF